MLRASIPCPAVCRMLTNEKLFLRAIGIVREVTGAGADLARLSILRAIHEEGAPATPGGGSFAGAGDAASPWWMNDSVPLDAHVRVAAVTPLVIPVAILLAYESVLGSTVHSPAAVAASATSSAATVLRREPQAELKLRLSSAGARDLLKREPRVAQAMALLSSASSKPQLTA